MATLEELHQTLAQQLKILITEEESVYNTTPIGSPRHIAAGYLLARHLLQRHLEFGTCSDLIRADQICRAIRPQLPETDHRSGILDELCADVRQVLAACTAANADIIRVVDLLANHQAGGDVSGRGNDESMARQTSRSHARLRTPQG